MRPAISWRNATLLLLLVSVACNKSQNPFLASNCPVKVRGGSVYGQARGGWSTCGAELCATVPKGDSYNLASENFDTNIPTDVLSPQNGQTWRITFTNPDQSGHAKDAIYLCNYPNCQNASGTADNKHVFMRLANSNTSNWEPSPQPGTTQLYYHDIGSPYCKTNVPHQKDGPCDKLLSAKLQVNGTDKATLTCSEANVKKCVVGVSSE
jgi:hypothetical protein